MSAGEALGPSRIAVDLYGVRPEERRLPSEVQPNLYPPGVSVKLWCNTAEVSAGKSILGARKQGLQHRMPLRIGFEAGVGLGVGL